MSHVQLDTRRQVCASLEEKQPTYLITVITSILAGTAAVPIMQPMLYAKNIQQASGKGTHLSIDPRIWYRGICGITASFVPTVTLQLTVTELFKQHCHPLCASSLAGAASAFVVGPAELIMIQQQHTGLNFKATIRHIHASYGIQGFFRALLLTSGREGGFTAAYAGAAPLLKQTLEAHGLSENISQITAGIVAGTVTACLTQPLDTLKTKMQSHLCKQFTWRQELFQQSSFTGLTWRILMIDTAIVVMSYVTEQLQNQLPL